MKSLEEVIKYKLNFLPEGIDPFYDIQTYTLEGGTAYVVYKTKNVIFSNDLISVIEDITPLFIYISSCDKYYREIEYGKFDILLLGVFTAGGKYPRLGFTYAYGDFDNDLDSDEDKIAILKASLNENFSREGYCEHYTEPITVELWGGFSFFLTYEERLAIQRRLDERLVEEEYDEDIDIEEEELSINDSRTFKLDQCVICLEKEPKVLFCNCGHICICDECLVKKLDNCPVCKEINTILRVIE